VSENYLIIKAARKESSLSRYRIRAEKDVCLHNDVENFIAKHGGNVTRLVDKLVNDDFALARLTDHEYPV
jgi:hypothetical protein